MTIFKSQKVTDLEARVATLEGENATLTGELEAARTGSADVTALNLKITALETANAEIPTLEGTISEHLATIGTLNTAISGHAQIVSDLTEKATVSAAKIDAAAADKLAAMGHGERLDLGKTGDESADAAIKSLTGYAKVSAFFKSKEK